jgi:hypothetical protein
MAVFMVLIYGVFQALCVEVCGSAEINGTIKGNCTE